MTALALALDIGGTKLETALVTAIGAIVPGSRTRRPTGPTIEPEGMCTAIREAITAAVAALPESDELVGVGIGSAGPIDLIAGTIAPVNMPRLRGFALVEAVQDSVGVDVPVVLRHDGGCLALAESWVGATAGARASMSIVVSTGVGGGLVIEGRPIGGSSGNAGHLGQTHADQLTLEEIASGPASVAWARDQGWTGETGEDLARDAAAGGSVARAAIGRSADAVGRALADASTLLDLEVVAVGGGFSRSADDYVELVGGALAAHAVLPYAQRTRVVRSGLGDEGPLIGAGALVFEA